MADYIEKEAMRKALREQERLRGLKGLGWVEAAMDKLPTLTLPSEWVSVEERLPEKKQDVLMLFDTGNMAVGWWHDADEHITFWCAYTDDGFYTDCDCIPTHWMLLPAPPEKEGDR